MSRAKYVLIVQVPLLNEYCIFRYHKPPKLFGGKVERWAFVETVVLVACRGGVHDEEVRVARIYVIRIFVRRVQFSKYVRSSCCRTHPRFENFVAFVGYK